MTIEQLRHFIAVAECKSFSSAAAKTHITQPSLSLSISRLESEIGFSLFERSKYGAFLTDNGRPILNKAIEILGLVGELTSLAEQQNNDKQTNITICTISTLSLVLPGVVEKLKNEFPNAHVQIIESGNRIPRDMLISESADIGLISKRYPIDESMIFKPIINDRMIACVPKDSYLAQQKIVRYADLAAWPLAMPIPEFSRAESNDTSGLDMTGHILTEFEKRGIEPIVSISTRQSRLTRVLGAQTGCIYFQPTILNLSDPAILSGEYVSRPLETKIACCYGILYLKSHKKSASFKYILGIIEEEMRSCFQLNNKNVRLD